MFKDVLKQIRMEKKYTQESLSEALGISIFALRKYESGEREPDFKTLIKIADFFDVSTDYMLGCSNLKRINSLEFISNSKSLNDDIRKLSPEQQEELTLFLNKCYLIIERQILVRFDKRLLEYYKSIVHGLMYMDAYLDGYLESTTKKRQRKYDREKIEQDIKLKFYESKESIINNIDALLDIYISNVMSDLDNIKRSDE